MIASFTDPNLGEYFLKNLLASTRGLVALFVSVASEVWVRRVLPFALVAVSSVCREEYSVARH